MWKQTVGTPGLWALQCQVGMGTEILKGLGAGLSLGSCLPVPPPAEGSPRCSWGVLWLPGSPDWYFSLDVLVFFQSSRFP